MTLGIVGTGNVGSAFQDIFSTSKDVNTLFWYSRNPKERQYSLDYFIPAQVDILLLAIPDNQIAYVGSKLMLQSENTVVAHVSGATPSNLLSVHFKNYGVLYPVQTIRKQIPIDWRDVPICITGNEYAVQKLYQLANAISNNVVMLGDEGRLHLHLAAVMINNFTNHLAVLTRDFLQGHQVDFTLLNSLIKESASKLTQQIPDFTQTGPAIRKDFETIERHKALLKNNEALSTIYSAITNSIINYYNKEDK